MQRPDIDDYNDLGNYPEDERKQSPVELLLRWSQMHNLVGEIDRNDIIKIGRDVVKFAKLDDASREDWLKKSEKAMDLALQVVEQKSTPWPNASNIKYPIITSAALQFQARAYPVIIQDNKVVKSKVTGADPDGVKVAQGKRIEDHLNYQLLEENEDWECDVDRMLIALPIEGCQFKKTYYHHGKGYNVSELVRPKDFIVKNDTKSLDTVPRATHRLYFHPYEIDDKQQSGLWDDDVTLHITQDERDEETLQEFYEQFCYLDLNDDGKKEPYFVTVHVKSCEVVRISPAYLPQDIIVSIDGDLVPIDQVIIGLGDVDQGQRAQILSVAELIKVNRVNIYTKFSMFPSPDGSFYDIGFGQIAGPISDAIDTNFNQLIDAGTLSNSSGGFIRDGVSVSGQRGDLRFTMGEFKRVKVPSYASLNDSVFQIKHAEPSVVLFQLLGFLVNAGKEITGIQDIMTGGAASPNEPASTTLARLEQGLKVFNAIYKRIFRSLKSELRKIYKLNARYLQPEQYYTVLDSGEQGVVTLADYRNDRTDVQPVADPQMASNLMSLAKAQALLPLKGEPGINNDEINKIYINSLDVPNADKLIIPADQRQPPPPDPVLNLAVMRAASEHAKTQADIIETYSKVIKNLADAESKEAGEQLEKYKQDLEAMIARWSTNASEQAGVLPVEAAPGNAGVPQSPGQVPGGVPQGVPGPMQGVV
jgi:chaperonin GroES